MADPLLNHMLLRATYRNGADERTIGRYVTWQEPDGDPTLPPFGRTKQRSRIEFEEIGLSSAIEALERLHVDAGFLQIELGDRLSSVDIVDYGDGSQLFIEQYFDLIYGGVYDLPTARKVVEALFAGITSNDLRDLFPALPGELIYDYEPGAKATSPGLNKVSAEVRNALAPFIHNRS